MPETLKLRALARELAEGRTTARKLVRECLDRIADPEGEGERAFVKVHSEQALAAASAIDLLREAGLAPSPFAGIPVSVKDLADIAGDVTTAGSVVLSDAPPAAQDAPMVARLRAVGFIVIGRTNMTEFAFSGIGINPHYGTPASPFDRATRRIPGGSSSGAAVSVADGMAAAGIGSDTGGSCRIPAALCGIVGFKPTASAVPREGVVPLSTTLDSIGPLANSVECCRIVHAILSGRPVGEAAVPALKGMRIAVPQTVVLDGLDAHVASRFERALDTLSRAGALVSHVPMKEFAMVEAINAKGGLTAAEAYAWHRGQGLIESRAEDYDPRVLARLVRAREQTGADYVDALKLRAAFIAAVEAAVAPFDVLAMPTVPLVAPAITALEADADLFTATNLAMLRNPAIVNMFDGCSISLPMHRRGEAPAGLMLAATAGRDGALFAHATAIEAALAP
ncbi:amidase [Rhizobiaceae bacterium BDR2-2]|uniref:Amidase n=1 Tax=Ectorhizobium quercum TaxID=2965071 RepID=A0AAE3SVB9_9HYPH|nr:amidase [Ectorhizobium quercum]MCX8996175.1 amidase [Ectorhizobium quercum]MCX8998786.1 amidase [Ectorhizobium quercum]